MRSFIKINGYGLCLKYKATIPFVSLGSVAFSRSIDPNQFC
ncbi:hypothetical protein LDG_6997 [Legionella drancourtii LLAP12]|uniref:Uncharacterized protein n=1 Tax=Legionella drancourtii LLAP12 TaxID=658187 RepID=G9EP17_9GAMM|nr:hypothetical protein LDG_6997 [Legionella drancourtii LLAP12]